MKKYARVEDGKVVEVKLLSTPLEKTYHKDVAKLFVECPKQEVANGWEYDGVIFSPPKDHPDTYYWEHLTNHRDLLLQQSDYTQLSDSDPVKKESWASYRKYLRDFPQNNENMDPRGLKVLDYDSWVKNSNGLD